MKNELPKFNYNVLIFIILGAIIFICILIFFVYKGEIINHVQNENLKMKISNFFSKGKLDCLSELTYCFVDSDCSNNCINSEYTCSNGICKESIITSIDPSTECIPEKGMIGYLIGNTAFGSYEFVCKSVDPAIAISNTENKMCNPDPTFTFNYLEQFPTIEMCECSTKVLIPATSEKREHVECSEAFHDLISY
ncbi:PIF-3 [Dikerogammarus haemobaphes nudivirus]|nr:PIF-3 [Dikerogammarus haemobaphes nudivirus]